MDKESYPVEKVAPIFKVGTPCYALYYGPRRDKDPRWVPAVVTKVFGSRSVNVRVYPRGITWRRHLEQLRARYTSPEDAEPGDTPVITPGASELDTEGKLPDDKDSSEQLLESNSTTSQTCFKQPYGTLGNQLGMNMANTIPGDPVGKGSKKSLYFKLKRGGVSI